jgi:hypothetical protein
MSIEDDMLDARVKIVNSSKLRELFLTLRYSDISVSGSARVCVYEPTYGRRPRAIRHPCSHPFHRHDGRRTASISAVMCSPQMFNASRFSRS